MSNTGGKDLGFLLRKNHGNRTLQNLEFKILDQTNIKEISLTSLDQRDKLWESFCFLLEKEESRSILKFENQESNLKIRKLFNLFTTSTKQFSGYLFLSNFKDVGAIKLSTPSFFENAHIFLEIDNDSIFLLDEDLENGIMVDFYESDIGVGWTYEVIILGQKWCEIFSSTPDMFHSMNDK